MSVSIREVVGKLVKRTITKGKREVEVKMLLAENGEEMLIRRDRDSIPNESTMNDLLDKQVKALGAVDGSVFIISQIAEI